MPRGPSTRRYAQAVFELAAGDGSFDQWLDDFGVLASAIQNTEFAELLDAPQIAIDEKVRIVNQVMDSAVNPLAVNLLCLLASRGAARLVPSIAEQYQVLLDAERSIERAEVVSAVPLSDDQRQRIVELLKGIVGKDVTVESRVEPALLGGFIARVGDRVVDGSTRTKLDQMRRELVDGA